MTVQNVFEIINQMAPFNTQMGFDNAGVLIGSQNKKVKKIGVVLDVTCDAVDYAKEQGMDLIISHHPVIFSGLKSIDGDSVVYRLIQEDIAVISAHTNLDAAENGVNQILAQVLGLTEIESLGLPGEPTPAMGRIGKLSKAMSCEAFAQLINQKLNTRVKFVNTGKEISKVAVCGGAGEDFILPAVQAGADALVTADVKHHNFLLAKSLELSLMDAGHFETEQVIVPTLCKQLEELVDIPVSVIPQTSPVEYV